MIRDPIPRVTRAFTLIELLVVIAIIGILASIAVPTMNSFKPNIMAAASQQLAADIGRARQLAISERTTVYMLFLPPQFWTNNLAAGDRQRIDSLRNKQFTSYTFFAARSLGDQPGTTSPRYLSGWRTLPEGSFIPGWKFVMQSGNLWTNIAGTATASDAYKRIYTFETNSFPFPNGHSAGLAMLPYIAFNYRGEMLPRQNVPLNERPNFEIIPLARGNISVPTIGDTAATNRAATTIETPPNNSVAAYNLVYVDRLTGRAKAIRQEVR